MPSLMANALLHSEICRLRVAQEESCRKPSSRRRLKLWNVSVQCTTALLVLGRMHPPSTILAAPKGGHSQRTMNLG